MRASADGGGYGGTIVVDIDGVHKASVVLANDAYAFQELAGRVRGRALPEMPDGVAGLVASALAEVGGGLAVLPQTLIEVAQELRVRALWAGIADQLSGGYDLQGTQLAGFKAAYAGGLLTRYAEPWEADLAKAYAKKLDDSEHHGGSFLDHLESKVGHLGSDALSGVEDAGSWTYQNVVIPTANGAATLGNAMINDPFDTGSTLLGGLVFGFGTGIEGVGTGLDATGVGAVVGVPLNVAGAGVMAAGAGLATKGTIGLANYATEHPIEVVQESDPGKGVDRGDGRDAEGKFASGNSGHIAADKEAQGLQNYEERTGRPVIPDKVGAKLPDGTGPRFYDGLSENPDGTYTGVEVKSGSAATKYGGAQRAFDGTVSSDQPATARLNGRTIKITSVIIEGVP